MSCRGNQLPNGTFESYELVTNLHLENRVALLMSNFFVLEKMTKKWLF